MSETARDQHVAVIGMAGRFPGAANLDEFRRNIEQGVDSIQTFTREQLLAAGVPAALADDPRYVPAAGTLDGIELFDADLLGYTSRESEILDPQHRLLLECAWEALEHAGYDPQHHEQQVGVFAGCGLNQYWKAVLSHTDLVQAVGEFQVILANSRDYVSTRLSYKLGLRGPSMTILTACSTSLVAVHQACQSLLVGECDMALAGGVNVLVPHTVGQLHQEGGIFSPDGRARAFDADAKGTVAGNGLGLVVLRRYEDAERDGDTIHAIVRGSAVNNDGSEKVGFTAPGVESQARVIRAAHRMSELSSERIGYLEAHGTGTVLGDPIEVSALTQAFRQSTDQRQFCALGSVKSNIGHLDAAAGIAGFLKALLALRHGFLPPSVHFERPNPAIDFPSSPFFVNKERMPWPSGRTPRCAGVSSLGLGGTNAHVVLEEAEAPRARAAGRPEQLVVLSGQSREALDQGAVALAEHLATHPETRLDDVAFTLQQGRAALRHRWSAVCTDSADAVARLREVPRAALLRPAPSAGVSTVLMFPGQGTLKVGAMGSLRAAHGVFRDEVERCIEIASPRLGFDLRSVLFPSEDERPTAEERIQETAVAQPALFALEYALARLWMSWGVQPAALVGHSLGELTAAGLSGALTLEDAVGLAVVRGELMQSLPEGRMLSIARGADEVRSMLPEHLDLAADNAPSACVASGPPADVERFKATLEGERIPCKLLPTNRAFHSSMVEPALEPFRAALAGIRFTDPELPLLSTLTADRVGGAELADPEHWVRHLRRSIRFREAIGRLLSEEDAPVFLEVGPGKTLSTLVAHQDPGATSFSSCPALSASTSETRHLLEAAGKVWEAGVPVRWPALEPRGERRRIPLPTYAFQRREYWLEPLHEPDPPKDAEQRDRRPRAEWVYRHGWRSAGPIRPPSAPDDQAGGSWLVFMDDAGVGAAAVEILEGRGERCVRVLPGEGFSATADSYTLRPEDPAGYAPLLSALEPGAWQVLHLWGVTGPEAVESTFEERYGRDLRRCFESLLYLAQAWGTLRRREPLSLSVVTAGLQSVRGDEAIVPTRALALGPARVIAQEYPGITSRCIDVEPAPSDEARRGLAAGLIAEIETRNDSIVAHRGRLRWLPDLFLEVLPQPEERPALREGGVYVITGGLGGIGLAIAEDFARTAGAKLALLSRSTVPPRGEWDPWLEEHGPEDPTSRRIRGIRRVEALGGEVVTLAADVGDRAEVDAALEQVRSRFGAIAGVVHAAGVPGAGLIQNKTMEDVLGVFRPKIDGAQVMLEATLADEPDFVVLFSSLVTQDVAVGQVDYCTANLFLGALARSRARSRTKVLTIDWAHWTWDDWQARYFSEDDPVFIHLREGRARYGIRMDEGPELMRQLLATDMNEAAVSPLDFDPTRGAESTEWLDELESAAGAGEGEARGSGPLTLDGTIEVLSSIWAELLGDREFDPENSFFDAGGDSVMAIQFVSRIRNLLGVELPLSTLFEVPTMNELAQHIVDGEGGGADALESLLDEIEQLSPDEAKALLEQELGQPGSGEA